jgi:ABC-type uncharacterized transport system ATPase subunit
VLELRDLARRYGDVVALDGISFTVGAGQMFGFDERQLRLGGGGGDVARRRSSAGRLAT